METSLTNIVIVDDHQIFIDGVSSLFVNDARFNILGSANNSAQLFSFLESCSKCIVLLDLNLGKEDGLDILIKLRDKKYDQKVIALTMYNLPNLVKKVIECGGNGYVLKNISKSNLKEAIIKVSQGETYLDPSLNNTKSTENKRFKFNEYPDAFLKKHNLSKREYEIIILLSESYATKEIADELNISEQTVSTYRKNIKAKMNFKSTTDIVRFVFENNLN